ncbi:MAG: hypothetical protein K9N51_03795 [Candidatus Pacebacteria bacterium]|nr:hypothetical protein [Candidatus Paceibacterota bacterium]
MTERTKGYNVELLTPCFCHGADCRNNPEIRAASIRGQIREWRRMREQEANTIEDVWGGDKGGMKASKVALELSWEKGSTKSGSLLPHKGGPKRDAVPHTTAFTLTLRRLVGCTTDLWIEAKRDVETWLLLGCLGQRANRAAGSVWCRDWQCADADEFRQKLQELSIPKAWDVRLCTTDMTADKARETASDTVQNKGYFGEIPRKDKPGTQRVPSPTKMKVIKLGDGHRLLLMAATQNLLDGAIACLKEKHDARRWRDLEFRRLSQTDPMT